jgi:enoyl-CoA hydratase/carnithine racemase
MTDTAAEAPAEPVLVKERRGAVQVLRLNRPEARNALNPELLPAWICVVSLRAARAG